MHRAWVVNAILLLIAAIWGFGFIPQKEGLSYFSAAGFNAMRFALGALTLIPVLLLLGAKAKLHWRSSATLWLGMALGVLLYAGAMFQQVSLQYTDVTNVAFITGLYVIVVPTVGYFIGYKYGLVVWSGGLLAIVGMYLMTASGSEVKLKGDLLALIGAVFWALQLLLLAKRAAHHDQMLLAFYQFFFCALLAFITAMLTGEGRILPAQNIGYLWALLNGVVVVGIGYTLQVVIMKYADPFAASLIFALEAVFGAIGGYFVYQERLDLAGLIGAAMMLIGCVLAQMPKRNAPSEKVPSNLN